VSVAAQSAAAAAAGIGSPDMRNLEGRLKTMQIILLANLAILVVVLAWAFQLNRQLSQNRDELRELRMQAQTAVSQFTPELDAKLGGFDKRMSGLDDELKAGEEHMENGIAVRMKLAQDQLFTNLDAKMKSTEERMVNRMDTEIPSMLDKYINKKLTELKH
jgi:membrane protein implicated in regulation of membrane protease activity